MKRERNYYFDNIKAILIFLVVLGHVLSKFGNSVAADLLYKIIFSFHMPAFLFVSGYFAKFNPKKVFSTLFPLYVLFQVLQYVERWILGMIDSGNGKPGPFDFFTPQWTLWYLVALMMFQLLLPVFDTENKVHQVMYLLLAAGLGLAMGLTPYTDNFMAMSRVFVFLPFYLLGYYERKNQILIRCRKNRHKKAIRGIAAVFAGVLIIFFEIFEEDIAKTIFYGTNSYADVKWFLGRLFAWFVAFLWILILLIWVPERKLGFIETIGHNTLPIYLFHSLVILILRATPLKQIIDGNLAVLIILSAILTVCLSWSGFENMLRKIRIPYTAK